MSQFVLGIFCGVVIMGLIRYLRGLVSGVYLPGSVQEISHKTSSKKNVEYISPTSPEVDAMEEVIQENEREGRETKLSDL